MPLTSPLVFLAGALLLGGCACFQKSGEPPEDAEVAARCTPVKSLLSKNVRARGNGAVPLLFSAGGLYERSGAILDPADAARAVRVDQACRAWVKGDLTPKEYARVVLDNTSATIVQTTSTNERPEIVAAVVSYLDSLKATGGLPSQFDSGEVAGQVDSFARLTKEELDTKLSNSMAAIDERFGTLHQAADVRQAELVSRLDVIDRRLSAEWTAKGLWEKLDTKLSNSIAAMAGRLSAANEAADIRQAELVSRLDTIDRRLPAEQAVSAGPDTLDIFFSTGSSELQFFERQRLEAAARGWVRSGATIYVLGFADPRGKPAYNTALSRARAKAVADLLVRLNVTVGAVSGGGAASGDKNDFLRHVHLRSVISLPPRRH